jgi:hypothetical protein
MLFMLWFIGLYETDRLTAKLLLALASTVILGTESHWTHMTMFYCLTALGDFRALPCMRVPLRKKKSLPY